MTRLRALLVDVGGTLVDDTSWPPPDRVCQLQLERLADAYGETRPWFAAFVEHAFAGGAAGTYEQRTAERVAEFLIAQAATPSEGEVERICRAACLPMAGNVRLEDHAFEALSGARRLGLRIGICSNTLWRGDEESRSDWAALGFGDLFDAHVTSRSTGYEKPHPAIFQRCLVELGVEADAAAMLGDRPERDVLGASRLGIRTIWKRPPGFADAPDPPDPSDPPHPAPDATIDSLAELPALLEAWARGGNTWPRIRVTEA